MGVYKQVDRGGGGAVWVRRTRVGPVSSTGGAWVRHLGTGGTSSTVPTGVFLSGSKLRYVSHIFCWKWNGHFMLHYL